MEKVSNISFIKLSGKVLIVFGIFVGLASGNSLLGIHPEVNIPKDERQTVESTVDRNTNTLCVENDSKASPLSNHLNKQQLINIHKKISDNEYSSITYQIKKDRVKAIWDPETKEQRKEKNNKIWNTIAGILLLMAVVIGIGGILLYVENN